MSDKKTCKMLDNIQLKVVEKINKNLCLKHFEYISTIANFLPISSNELVEFKKYWENMSKDSYVENFTNRFRKIARFISTENGIEIDHSNTVKTSKKYNPIAGGITREYEYAPKEFIENPYFQKILNFNNALARAFLGHSEIVITCHLFRIAPSENKSSAPITIGKHKDDTELVALHYINGQNLLGGLSRLYTNDGELVPDSEVTLCKFGESIYIDDIALLHETTPIQRKDINREATRDVLLFMMNSKEMHLERMSE